MSHNTTEPSRVQGTVAPGFESVKRLYENEMRTMAEKNTQLCVYYKGAKVVDLWASAANDERFSPDTLVNIFSSGKSLESIAIAWLVGKGFLDYNAKVVDYWPEFSANGKGELTVAEVMRHEGGMAAFNTSLDAEDLLAENIKQNAVGRVIEAQPLRFRKGNGATREYHALTRGWIANEIFRRVDPAGRTIGEFLREEISQPLDADTFIGVRESELGRISKIIPLGFGFQLIESLKPRILGRKIRHNFFQILERLLRAISLFRNSTTRGAPAPYKGFKKIEFFNQPSVAMGETPSAAANSSARGLAKIAAMMSAGGKWKGREYLGKEVWEAMHADPIEAEMGFTNTNFTKGGVNRFSAMTSKNARLDWALNEGREGFYGWMGLGGSIFQWHPGHEIGFGFVPTSLHVLDILNERGKTYQAEVLSCVERLKD